MPSAFWFIFICGLICFTMSVNGISDDIIQRKILSMKTEVIALRDNWIKKIKLWNEYNYYKNCLYKLEHSTDEDSRRFIQTKYYTEILGKMEQVSEINLKIVRRLKNKILEIYPGQILLVNGLNSRVKYNAIEMKTSLTDILSPLSRFTEYLVPFETFNKVNCTDITHTNEKQWMPVMHFNSCSNCDIADFVLLPNGSIVSFRGNYVEIYSHSVELIRRFFSKVLPDEQDAMTFWKDNKILLLSIKGKYGNIYEIDLDQDTVQIIYYPYPYTSSNGISVIGNLIVTCSYQGILFVFSPTGNTDRNRRYNNYGQYYDVSVYKSEFGSDYGLFVGELFHNRYTLVKSSGERVCSVHIPEHTTSVAPLGMVGKDGTFVLAYNWKFQAYDNSCNPLGNSFMIDSNYYPWEVNLLNNSLYISARSKNTADFSIFTYALLG